MHPTESMEACAHICHECQEDLGGEHASREHQTLLADCVAICGVSHNLLHRQSPQHILTCPACAEICARCAEDCERMGKDDAQVRECAKACRLCAESCEGMASAVH